MMTLFCIVGHYKTAVVPFLTSSNVDHYYTINGELTWSTIWPN